MNLTIESKRAKFKLIARVNTSGLELMEWCDEVLNFSGMCILAESVENYKNVEYVKKILIL